jgi:hypothetical protein
MDPSGDASDPAPKRLGRRPLKGVIPRPKLRRTGHITIRLSPEEREALDAASERAGLMNGSYVRQVLFGAAMPRQVRRPPIEKKELGRLLGELGRVGNNLNQIAHATNAGLPVIRADLAKALEGLATVRDAILSALGRGA